MPEILLDEPVFSCTDLHHLILAFVPPGSALDKIYRSIGAAAGEEDDVLRIDLWSAWIARAERIFDEITDTTFADYLAQLDADAATREAKEEAK